MKRACILSTGAELVRGASLDTNCPWLVEKLGESGIRVVLKSVLDDDLDAISGAIRHAAEISDLVLVTGGLGPTPDDLTRQAVAKAMGTELVLDEDCLAQIDDFFHRRGRKMAEVNRIQAMIPRGAEAIANTAGTAPGIACTISDASVYVMPGVPREMKEMFTRCVAKNLEGEDTVALSEVLKVYGAGESSIVEMLGELAAPAANVLTGITVAAGLISIRITVSGPEADEAGTVLQERVEAVRSRIEKYVVSKGADSSMAQAVGSLLAQSGTTLATAESCTGGMIGQMITAVPGASEYFLGGVMAYSNDVKAEPLGVPRDLLEKHGAVSEQVAGAMASGARELFGSDWAIAATGIAGPSGGTEEKPVGLVYTSLAGPDGIEVNRWVFPGDRQTVRTRASLAALNVLRLKLLE